MVATVILVIGGAVVGGTRILLRRKRTRTPVWLVQSDGSQVKSYAEVVESAAVNEAALEREINTNYALSTISLGLTLAGHWLFDPIRWLGLPIDIYSFGTIIEQSYTGAYGPKLGAQLAAIGVFVITVTLSEQFITITLLQWSYFVYRKLAFDLQKQLMQPMPAAA